MAEAFIKGLYVDGQMAEGLLINFRKEAANGPETRRMTLALILVFATEAQLVKIRPDLLKVISSADEPEPVRILALEGYRPTQQDSSDEANLRSVLT